MQAPRCSRQNTNSPADSVLQLCSAYAILTRLGVTSRVYLRTATSGDCGTWSVMASPFKSPIHYKESQQEGVKRHLFCFRASMCKFICSNRYSKQRKGGSPLADSLCEGLAASKGDGRDGASNSERSSQSMPLLIAEQMIFQSSIFILSLHMCASTQM